MALKRLGFFKELPHGDPLGPSAAERSLLEQQTKDAVLRYLESGAVLAASQEIAKDYISQQPIGPLNLLTDGEWVWYSDLPYYLNTYNVVLDPDFVTSAKERGEVHLSEAQLLQAEQNFLQG